MVAKFFEVVVGSCGSFLLLVTKQNEVNNCAKVTLEGEVGGFCSRFTHKF